MLVGQYFSFVIFCSMLVYSPGPMTMLMMGLGMQNGFKNSWPAQVGASCAYLISLAIFAVGLSSLLAQFPIGLKLIQFGGAIYLLKMAYSQWKKSASDSNMALPSDGPPLSFKKKELYYKGFITAISNPKAFVIFGAIIPQFVSPRGDRVFQLTLLSVTYLAIQISCGLTYLYFGSRAKDLFNSPDRQRFFQKAMAMLLLSVAIMIAKR